MPELPEVETVARGVHARLAGARIADVWTSGKPQTFATPEAELSEVLPGSRIVAVRRIGKSVVIDLAAGRGSELTAQLLVHLGMTGRLLVSAHDVPLPPHTHLVASLTDGRDLRFVDARRFGRLSLLKLGTGEEPPAATKAWAGRVNAQGGFSGPGAEPTTISVQDFIALFRGRKLPIKAALLNQSLLHGIGNIYADESLFRAGIRPRRQAGRLTRGELTQLHAELRQVLAHAIELGGSSVSDYVDADGVRGFFQQQHKVYGRAGKACLDCGTALRKLIVGGRTTVYCPTCQH